MENCLAAACLNGVDRRVLQRSARLGREVLARAQRRAVNWHSRELPAGGLGLSPRERLFRERRPLAASPRALPGEVRPGWAGPGAGLSGASGEAAPPPETTRSLGGCDWDLCHFI